MWATLAGPGRPKVGRALGLSGGSASGTFKAGVGMLMGERWKYALAGVVWLATLPIGVAIGIVTARDFAERQAEMPEAKARRAVEHFKDPEGVRFRNLRLDGEVLCGELNGRNSYGGYIGFERFYVTPSGDLVTEEAQAPVDETTREYLEWQRERLTFLRNFIAWCAPKQ